MPAPAVVHPEPKTSSAVHTAMAKSTRCKLVDPPKQRDSLLKSAPEILEKLGAADEQSDQGFFGSIRRSALAIDHEAFQAVVKRSRAARARGERASNLGPSPVESTPHTTAPPSEANPPTLFVLTAYTMKLDLTVLRASIPSVALLWLLSLAHMTLVEKGLGSAFSYTCIGRVMHEFTSLLVRCSGQYLKERSVHWPVDFTALLLVGWRNFGWKPSMFVSIGVSTITYAFGMSFSTYLSLAETSRNPCRVFLARLKQAFSVWLIFLVVIYFQVAPSVALSGSPWPQTAYNCVVLPGLVWISKTFLLNYFYKKFILRDGRDAEEKLTLYR